MKTLAVVGLGLIGGSLALAAKRRGWKSVGIDRAEVVSLAQARAAAEVIDAADRAAVRGAVEQADLVVLAMPVGAILRELPDILEVATVVTDCGSTKRHIAARARQCARGCRFVAGHPMAGAPDGGVVNAREDLFRGHTWILCPDGADHGAVETVESFVRSLDAAVVRMTAEEHDRAVALTSHVPQLLASALTVLAERRKATVAAGPAFASATRVAGGATTMWRDIFQTNADQVAVALRELCEDLSMVAQALDRQGDADAALELLSAARELRQR
jgi:prephenate dehydrogenase